MAKEREIPEINRRITELMKSQGYTPRKFAKRLGVSYGMVYHVVSGDLRRPSFEMLRAIITTYPQISSDYLLLHDLDRGIPEAPAYIAPDEPDALSPKAMQQALRNAEKAYMFVATEVSRLREENREMRKQLHDLTLNPPQKESKTKPRKPDKE